MEVVACGPSPGLLALDLAGTEPLANMSVLPASAAAIAVIRPGRLCQTGSGAPCGCAVWLAPALPAAEHLRPPTAPANSRARSLRAGARSRCVDSARLALGGSRRCNAAACASAVLPARGRPTHDLAVTSALSRYLALLPGPVPGKPRSNTVRSPESKAIRNTRELAVASGRSANTLWPRQRRAGQTAQPHGATRTGLAEAARANTAIAAAEAGRTDMLARGAVPARSRASSPGEGPAGRDCIIVFCLRAEAARAG